MRAFTQHDARFASRLRRVREIRELDQQAIADAVGVGRSAVSDIEHGKRAVTVGEAVAICAVLGMSIERMLSPAPLTLTVDVPVDGGA